MAKLDPQSEDYKWFIENYDHFFKEFGHKFLVIKNHKVLGAYDSYADGVYKTIPSEELGTFIVQECNGNASAYTASIASLNFARDADG